MQGRFVAPGKNGDRFLWILNLLCRGRRNKHEQTESNRIAYYYSKHTSKHHYDGAVVGSGRADN
jgi:hypothetical protein